MIEERLEVAADGRDQRLLSHRWEVVVLIGIEALECGHLNGEQPGDISALISFGLLAEEAREDGMGIAPPLEFHTRCEGIPVVVTEPLIEIGR